MKKIWKKLFTFIEVFTKKDKMSYTNQEVSNITNILNQGTNDFSFIHNNGLPDTELSFEYKRKISFRIIYRIGNGGDIDFSLSNTSLFIEELTKELVGLSFVLMKNKHDILNHFKKIRTNKGLIF